MSDDVRPEVVAVIHKALTTFTSDAVAEFDALDYVTTAEREAALNLFAASLEVSADARGAHVEDLLRQALERNDEEQS